MSLNFWKLIVRQTLTFWFHWNKLTSQSRIGIFLSSREGQDLELWTHIYSEMHLSLISLEVKKEFWHFYKPNKFKGFLITCNIVSADFSSVTKHQCTSWISVEWTNHFLDIKPSSSISVHSSQTQCWHHSMIQINVLPLCIGVFALPLASFHSFPVNYALQNVKTNM